MKKLLLVMSLAVLLVPAAAKAGTELGLGIRYTGVDFNLETYQNNVLPRMTISPNNKLEMNARLGVKSYPFAFYLGINQSQGGMSVNSLDVDETVDTVRNDCEISYLSFRPELTLKYYVGEGTCASFVTASFWKGFGTSQATMYSDEGDSATVARMELMYEEIIGSFFSSLFGFSFGIGSEFQINECLSLDGTLGYFYEKTSPSYLNEWTEPAGDYREDIKFSASRGGIFGQLMINFAIF
jgi:opacity protein-like surface antigen